MITVIIPTLDPEHGDAMAALVEETAGIDCVTMPVLDIEGAGFTSTVNIGIKQAQVGDICLLNDDCELSPDWLAILSNEMERHAPLKVWFAGPSGPCRTPPQNMGRAGGGRRRRSRIVKHLAGFCLLIKGEAIAALGGLDPRFIHYASDVDLQWRARRDHEAKSLWVPAVYVNHALHQPRMDWWKQDQALLQSIWEEQ